MIQLSMDFGYYKLYQNQTTGSVSVSTQCSQKGRLRDLTSVEEENKTFVLKK